MVVYVVCLYLYEEDKILGVFSKEEEAQNQVKALRERHGIDLEDKWDWPNFGYRARPLDVPLKHYWEDHDKNHPCPDVTL